MNIVERVKNILLSPATEWDKIAVETTTPKELMITYVLPLAALSAVMQFVKLSVFGVGFITFGIGIGLAMAVFHFIMAFIAVFVIAFITDALAPGFGGTKDMNQAVKLTAYTFTASWIGSVFGVIPWVGWLLALVIGLYGLYILYLGLPKLMKNPQDKTIVYEIVLIIVAIVVMVVIGAVGNAITVGGLWGSGALSGGGLGGLSRHSQVTIDPNSSLGKLDQYAKSMADAGKKIEEAQKSGDQGKATAAAIGALGAAMGGKGVDPVQIDQLKPFVPDTFAGLPRKDMRTERGGVQGFMTAKAEGVYNDGAGKNATLEVVDSGGAAGMLGMAAWANLQSEKEDANHKESTRKEGDRLIHERLDKNSNYGEFTVVLANRYVVTAKGNVGLDGLKSSVASLDLGKLEALK